MKHGCRVGDRLVGTDRGRHVAFDIDANALTVNHMHSHRDRACARGWVRVHLVSRRTQVDCRENVEIGVAAEENSPGADICGQRVDVKNVQACVQRVDPARQVARAGERRAAAGAQAASAGAASRIATRTGAMLATARNRPRRRRPPWHSWIHAVRHSDWARSVGLPPSAVWPAEVGRRLASRTSRRKAGQRPRQGFSPRRPHGMAMAAASARLPRMRSARFAGRKLQTRRVIAAQAPQ